eukprot:scaffold3515_cov94-Isochrysis_galbana.AAC.2
MDVPAFWTRWTVPSSAILKRKLASPPTLLPPCDCSVHDPVARDPACLNGGSSSDSSWIEPGSDGRLWISPRVRRVGGTTRATTGRRWQTPAVAHPSARAAWRALPRGAAARPARLGAARPRRPGRAGSRRTGAGAAPAAPSRRPPCSRGSAS